MKVNTNERKNNKIALNHANNNTSKKRHIEHWKVVAFYLIIYDIIAVNFSYFFGLWLRFDLRFSNIPQTYLNSYLRFAPFYTVFVLVVFYALHLYKSLWRFASFSELNRIFASSVITTVFHIVCITLLIKRMPISYYVIGAAMQLALVTAIRFAYRYITLERTRRERSVKAVHNVMVIGAGAAGQVILKELKSSTEVLSKPCCVIDDNPNKWDRFMEGVPIVGGRDSIMESVEKYKIDQILLAIPTASPKDKRDILNICKETHCELKSLPGIYQLANGEVSLSRMKAVAVEDLLGRDPIKVNMEEIFQYIKGKTILVTGGGGSIGSELCRQIAGHEPKQLIIFDVYENNAYDIEQELKRKYKDKLNLVVLIGSVRDSRRINMVFENYKPDIVYHAAAHKHVPLMETSPNEAIKNNVVGTYKTAYAVLVLGDTNSCLSVIGAKRLHIPIFHMEAGNRCKDECLPEETNRRIVDIISDVNMAYSEHARRYLADCGLPKERTYVTGSPMAEVLHNNLAEIEASDIHSKLGLEKGKYILLSAHREENIDTEKNFLSLFNAINKMAEKYDMPILYSCHPRSKKRIESTGFKLDPRVIQHEPLGFHDYNCLQMNAFAVVSDSGTLPEESSFFTSVGHPFPAVCIRTSTERPEALDKACFILSGIDEKGLLQSVDTAVEMNRAGDYGIPVPDYIEENVSSKVVKIIQSYTGVVNKMVWRKEV